VSKEVTPKAVNLFSRNVRKKAAGYAEIAIFEFITKKPLTLFAFAFLFIYFL